MDVATEIYNVVSIFNHAYLPQFLAMYRSVRRHWQDAHVWAFCIDEEAVRVLDALDLPGLSTIDWTAQEPEAYAELRQTRTTGEYCWTLTPRSVLTVMDQVGSESTTIYVDADVWLIRSPSEILDEFKSSSLSTHNGARLLTPR